MRAFFHRLHLGGSKDKDRDNNNHHPPKDKEKFPPLPSWPPQTAQRPTSAATSNTVTAFKPLPEIVPAHIASLLPTRSLQTDSEPSPEPESTAAVSPPKVTPTPSQSDDTTQVSSATPTVVEQAPRSSRKTNVSTATGATDVHKKVAFISPPPTPLNLEQPLPSDISNPGTFPQLAGPLKTTVSRFQATYGKEPRGSVSIAASSSKTDIPNVNKPAAKSTTTRAVSPYTQKSFDGPSAQSLRSGTPYSAASNNTSGSRILAATSWSEVTEDDLVSNIGSRERTRQEVLFEIIQSEERYVQELVKMKDTFIDPLLHPYSTLTAASTTTVDYDYYRGDSPFESADDLLPPIAARFMSPVPSMNPRPSSSRTREVTNVEAESGDTDEEDETCDKTGKSEHSRTPRDTRARSPYRATVTRTGGRSTAAVPFPSRSHTSLPHPPPPGRNPLSSSAHSLGRQSAMVEHERLRKFSQESPGKGMLRKFRKSQVTPVDVLGNTIAPHQLPEDLRICLEVIDSGVFDGHKRLSEALKKRYDDQYPLVRSLADVFVSNSDIFKGYATYVLHLERALEQVDAALSNASAKKPKKQDAGEWQRVCKVLQQLEETAAERGETGLAITLSKPFQRLLKYPLLFQNLLYHTDPSTFEYESTLLMVAEVENIVRSIEDEKIQKEERDKTRDVFARIEGLDKVRQLVLPKPSRILLEERVCSYINGTTTKFSSPPPTVNTKGVRTKSSFKRLSDVLRPDGFGGKKDLWFVVFNDVVLQCQRTGTTSLPIASTTASRTNSLPELQGKAKYATLGRRNSTTKPRNLYRFLRIETWDIGEVVQPQQGIISMEDMAKSRTQAISSQPRIVPMPNDDDRDDGDSDESDKKSKMSFSYWGADKITVQKPAVKTRLTPGVNPRKGVITASYGRESSANAKFGTRLVSDGSSHTARPSGRRTQTPTSTRRPATSEEGPNYARATITRPAWDANTRHPAPHKRQRNTSQPSSSKTPVPVPVPLTPPGALKGPVASPAPSEDSGVGMYRQMLAKDPALNNKAS